MTSQTIQRIIEEVRQLPSELRRQLREALDREEQAGRDEHLSPNASPDLAADADTTETKRRLRTEWLKQHQAEYAGKYVALNGDQLLGVGATYPEAARAARASGVHRPYIDYIPIPGSVGFGGW